MMCGYELTTLSPSNGDLGNVRSEDQVEVSHRHGNTGVVVEIFMISLSLSVSVSVWCGRCFATYSVELSPRPQTSLTLLM